MIKTGSSNENVRNLISSLKEASIKNENRIWKRIALELEKPTRSRRIVNLSRINRYTNDGDVVIVPGKLLGAGTLTHKVTIAALNFSDGAAEKVSEVKGTCVDILELVKKNPKGTNIKIIG